MIDSDKGSTAAIQPISNSDNLLSSYLGKSGMSLWVQPGKAGPSDHIELIEEQNSTIPALQRVDCGCNGGNCSC